MSTDKPKPQPETERKDSAVGEETPVVLQASKLLGGAREVLIEHQGTRYRLRLTRRGKLILQK